MKSGGRMAMGEALGKGRNAWRRAKCVRVGSNDYTCPRSEDQFLFGIHEFMWVSRMYLNEEDFLATISAFSRRCCLTLADGSRTTAATSAKAKGGACPWNAGRAGVRGSGDRP